MILTNRRPQQSYRSCESVHASKGSSFVAPRATGRHAVAEHRLHAEQPTASRWAWRFLPGRGEGSTRECRRGSRFR